LAPVGLDELHVASQADTAASPGCDDGRAAAAGAAAETWSGLAARSVCVARLGRDVARHLGLDAEAAYLLGLLHLAPRWLTEVGLGALPAWLRDELGLLDSGDATGRPQSAADCARAAVQLVQDGKPSAPELASFAFDGQLYQAQVALVRRAWLEGGRDDLVQSLLEKLRRLRELEQHFERTLQTEELESLKELAYGAGHEINNPLANISARAQTLLAGESDPQRRRMLAAINSQAFRAHEMIADMMLFARPPRPKRERFDMAELATTLEA